MPFYWMAGFRSGAENFFFFLLVIWQLAICSAAFAEWVAAMAPNADSAGLLYIVREDTERRHKDTDTHRETYNETKIERERQ